MYYAGLDLHTRYFTVCVLTSMGEVVLNHRRLPADLEPLQSILRARGPSDGHRRGDLAVGLAP